MSNESTPESVNRWAHLASRWKLLILVTLLVTGTLTAVVWKSRAFLLADKMAALNDSTAKQMAPLKRLVHDRLDNEKAALVRAALAHASNHHPNLVGFDVVSMLETSDNNSWAPAWLDRSGKPEGLPEGFDLTLLKSLPAAKVKDGNVLWSRLSDQQGRPVYALLMSVELQNAPGAQREAGALPEGVDYAGGSTHGKRAVLAGLTLTNPLADVTEEFIGSSNTVFVVDDKGYVASHENKAYLGALFSEDPIVNEITASHRAWASGRYEDLESRPVLGRYERIENSNLYAVITTPTAAVTSAIDAYTKIAFGIGGLCGIAGLIAAYLMSRRDREPREIFVEREVEERPAPVAAPVVETPVVAPARPFNSGFREAIKEPLLAILGHAQLAGVKAGGNEAELRAHTDSIEREARRAQDVLEQIEAYTKAERPPRELEKTDLPGLVRQLLSLRETALEEEGVVVDLEMIAVPVVRGSGEQLLVAIGNLIDNAREAMKKRPLKRLRISLDDEGAQGVLLTVSDTGIGMSRDVSEKAFEPFFKAFDNESGLGLGLSIVQSTMNEIGGSASVVSAPGEGAAFKLRFPIDDMDRAMFRERMREADAPKERESTPDVGMTDSMTDTLTDDVIERAPTASDPELEVPSAPMALQDLSFIESEPPAGASAALSFEDDDEDDEMFANVPLKTVSEANPNKSTERDRQAPWLEDDDEPETMTIAPVSAPKLELELDASGGATPAPPTDESKAPGFQVKIRRPRKRS